MSRDPLASLTREPYAYASGSPLDVTDPLGLCGNKSWWSRNWKKVALVAAVVALAAVAAVALPAVLEGGSEVVLEEEAAEAGGGDFVSVFRGSINDATSIAENGLDAARTPTWVSRDLQAAQDAIGPNRIDVMNDPGIIESRIPTDQFAKTLAPSERPDSTRPSVRTVAAKLCCARPSRSNCSTATSWDSCEGRTGSGPAGRAV